MAEDTPRGPLDRVLEHLMRIAINEVIADHMGRAAASMEEALLLAGATTRPEDVGPIHEKMWASLRERVMLVVVEKGHKLALVRQRVMSGELSMEEGQKLTAEIMRSVS